MCWCCVLIDLDALHFMILLPSACPRNRCQVVRSHICVPSSAAGMVRQASVTSTRSYLLPTQPLQILPADFQFLIFQIEKFDSH